MTNYTLMSLINWLEGAGCKCFYVFEGTFIKNRYLTQQRKEMRMMYLRDSKSIASLCQHLYALALPWKEDK